MRLVRSSVVLSLLAAAVPAAAQTLAGGAAAPAMGGFGAAVAVTPAEVLVGEPGNVMRSGLVYVYRKSAGGWAEAAQLKAADGANADGFGVSLAVDGSTLLVGAAAGAGRVVNGRGAYVFTRRDDGAWTQSGRITATDVAEADAFGVVVALEGDWAAIAAPAQNETAGAVYLFRRGAAGWTQAQKLTAPTPAANDAFGAALALEGGRLFVGMPNAAERTGKVLVWTLDGSGQWQPAGEVSAQGVERNDRFGAALAAAGDRLLVAAPFQSSGVGAVYAFRWSAEQNQWVQSGRLLPFAATRQDMFGSALALDGDGVWVGAPRSAGGGAVFAVGGDQQLAQRLVPSEGGQFGAALALSGAVGAVGIVGADNGAGVAAIYERGADGLWKLATSVKSPPEALAPVTGGRIECEGAARAAHFDCSNVDLLAFLPVTDIGGGRGVRVNDVWGWTDPATRREYAIVGRVDGTSFVDITDPENPRYLGDLPKTEGTPAATWRDVKVYENHAFIVADGAQEHGVQVFDLTRLRNVGEPQTFTEDAHYDGVASSHNIVINEATGFAYAVGSRMGGETCGGGLHMIDIREPNSPKFAGCFADPQTGRASTGYSHDAQCIVYAGPDEEHQGREICFGSNETMLSIADVTDKDSPKALARASYPNVGYSHQGWVTDDHRFFYMDDELDELQGKVTATRTLIWDIGDLDDPQLVGEFMGATQASDHNLYIVGNTMYQSNYQAGLRVVDISDRGNPVEVGYFDTVPYGTNTPGFGGSWSNYPYFPSGTIVVTSGSEGLFLLKKREGKPIS